METRQDSMVTVERFPARAGDAPRVVPVSDGMTLGDLLDLLALPADTEAVIVNGAHARPDYRLQSGDQVRIIPFMSGG
jgi:sulfur carrier protein ThiS